MFVKEIGGSYLRETGEGKQSEGWARVRDRLFESEVGEAEKALSALTEATRERARTEFEAHRKASKNVGVKSTSNLLKPRSLDEMRVALRILLAQTHAPDIPIYDRWVEDAQVALVKRASEAMVDEAIKVRDLLLLPLFVRRNLHNARAKLREAVRKNIRGFGVLFQFNPDLLEVAKVPLQTARALSNQAVAEANTYSEDFVAEVRRTTEQPTDVDLAPIHEPEVAESTPSNIQYAGVNYKTLIKKRSEELAALLKAHPDQIPVAEKAGLASIFLNAQRGQERGETKLKAPELWADRPSRRSESPVAFIKRVYATELKAKALTRPMLRELDKTLYDAYAAWIRPERHPEDDLKLATEPRANLDEVEDPVEHVRAQGRERMRRHSERQKLS